MLYKVVKEAKVLRDKGKAKEEANKQEPRYADPILRHRLFRISL
jgi:hypothetical protein